MVQRRVRVTGRVVLNMIGLANRVRMTIERSPGSLVRLSLAMHGLDQLQPLGKRFRPSNLFMSRISVNTCTRSVTRISLHAHDRWERAGLRSRFEEQGQHTKIRHPPRCSNPCFSGAPNPYHVMRFDRRGVLREAVGKWSGAVTTRVFLGRTLR